MLSRLFPLGVKVSFEDRVHELGETIHLAVELSPKRDIEVREARVDLVREEVWREVFTVMTPVTGASARDHRDHSLSAPLQKTKINREALVHSSVVFLEDTRLASGRTGSYDARLDIESKPPPHARGGRVRWRLVTTIDVAGARDIKARRLVKVA